VVLFPPCPPSSLCPRRTSSSPSSWCTVLITHLGFEHLSMESDLLFLFLVFGHVWSLSHLDCQRVFTDQRFGHFSRHVEFTSHEGCNGGHFGQKTTITSREGRNGGHFWPDDRFQLRGLAPFFFGWWAFPGLSWRHLLRTS